jgi:hypothetical protein
MSAATVAAFFAVVWMLRDPEEAAALWSRVRALGRSTPGRASPGKEKP